jgi:hypothetical protein
VQKCPILSQGGAYAIEQDHNALLYVHIHVAVPSVGFLRCRIGDGIHNVPYLENI